jgi:signal transduction histidine kinase
VVRCRLKHGVQEPPARLEAVVAEPNNRAKISGGSRQDARAGALEIREQERIRLSRELHDVLGQRVTALRLKVELLRQAEIANLAERIEDVLDAIDRIDRDLDFLAWELRPAELGERGLASALPAFVDDWADTFDIPATVQVRGLAADRFPPDVELTIYRIAQEALTNVGKHARAASVNVRLEQRRGRLVLTVADDGCGMAPDEDSTPEHPGMGLVAMRERAELAGGTIEVRTAPGNGTSVIVSLPLGPSDRASDR